jgi:glycosyltransferase involved in cell wall biosynthesis
VIRGSDVTVVIPTIPGRGVLLDRALRSVRAQQMEPGDVVIEVDKDRHGADWARNEAIKRVRTAWIAFLDDDDEFKPNHIKVLVRGANKSHADLIFTYAEFVGGRDPLACIQAMNSRDCEDYGLLLRLLDAGYKFHHVTGVRTWIYNFHDANTGGRGADRLHELS